MAQTKKYKDVGKKDIIGVLSQIIRKVEAIEMTLNLLIQFVDKKEEFNNFMKEQLGGKNELQSNETTNGKDDNSEHNDNT